MHLGLAGHWVYGERPMPLGLHTDAHCPLVSIDGEHIDS